MTHNLHMSHDSIAPDLSTQTRSNLLLTLLRALSLISLVAVLVTLIFNRTLVENWLSFGTLVAGALALTVVAFSPGLSYLVRASTTLGFIYIVAVFDLFRTGIVGDGRVLLLALTLLAFILFERRIGIMIGAANVVTIIIIALGLEVDLIASNGARISAYVTGEAWQLMTMRLVVPLFLIVLAIYIVLRDFERSLGREQELVLALERERSLLEQRVSAQTRALETSAQLGNELASILDPQQLISQVTNLVQEAYGYYHVHVYLSDADGQLNFANGTGNTGRLLLENKHSLQPGQGIVGATAFARTPVLVEDVTLDPRWVPNELLPETRSEAAVPIIVANRTIGVLDVQENIPNGLNESDVVLLEVIAAQLAVTLQNAELFARTQRRAGLEARVSDIGNQIRSSQQIDDVLQIVIKDLGDALESQRTVIKLGSTSPSRSRP